MTSAPEESQFVPVVVAGAGDVPATPSGSVRASDAERDEVAAVLSEVLAQGRLTSAELAERIDAAYGAKTRADLVPLTADLPDDLRGAPSGAPAAVERQALNATFKQGDALRPLGGRPAHRGHIKPSFLWMMGRCGWARKPGQERVLAVRITREGWETALSNAVLTSYKPGMYRDRADWERQLKQGSVRVQWDSERTLAGAELDARSIQVGLSRHIIADYVNSWTVEIRDLTATVRKMDDLIRQGRRDRAAEHLPKERPYEVPPHIARRLYHQA